MLQAEYNRVLLFRASACSCSPKTPPPPQISFIVPAYNVAAYLAECLDSILAQTIDKEIIIIDDGSGDETLQIALAYSRRFDFISVLHTPNQGQSAARNRGLRLARGEFVYCVDADDFLLPVDLQAILQLARQQQADVVKLRSLVQYEYADGSKSAIGEIIPSHPQLPELGAALFSGYECLKMMYRRWIPGVCWSIIRRGLLLEHGLFFAEGVQAEDQLFYVQLLSCRADVRLLEMNTAIYHYRRRADSTVEAQHYQYFADHLYIVWQLQQWKQQKALPEDVAAVIDSIIDILCQTAQDIFRRLPEHEKQQARALLDQPVL